MREVLCLYAVISVTGVAGVDINRCNEVNYTGVDVRQEELPPIAPVQPAQPAQPVQPAQPAPAAQPVVQTPDQVIAEARAEGAAASQRRAEAKATGNVQGMREASRDAREALQKSVNASLAKFRKRK